MTKPIDLIPAPVREILVANASCVGSLQLRLGSRGKDAFVEIDASGARTGATWSVEFTNVVGPYPGTAHGCSVRDAIIAALMGRVERLVERIHSLASERRRTRSDDRRKWIDQEMARVQTTAEKLSEVVTLVAAAWPETTTTGAAS